MAQSGQILGSTKIQSQLGMRMVLQERCRQVGGDRLFIHAFDDVRIVLAPCHAQHPVARQNIAQSERDSSGGSIVGLVIRSDLLAHLTAEEHQTGETRRHGARLVECQTSLRTHLAHTHVDAAATVDQLIVLAAALVHVLAGSSGAYSVYVLGLDINMVEEHLTQASHSARAFRIEGEKLAGVENNDILEAHTAGIIELDQPGIHRMSAYAGSESQHAIPFLGHILCYIFYDLPRDIVAPVGGCLEYAGINLFLASESGYFDLTLRVVIPSWYLIQFDL